MSSLKKEVPIKIQESQNSKYTGPEKKFPTRHTENTKCAKQIKNFKSCKGERLSTI